MVHCRYTFNDPDIAKIRTISDDKLVNRINSKVSKNDTLVLLGDVGDLSFVKKLKAGYKVLILGNHERGASNYKREIHREKGFIYCKQ